MRTLARFILLAGALFALMGAPAAVQDGTTGTLQAEAAPLGCPSTATPLAALPPAIPVWCQTLGQAPATFQQGANSWLDDFKFGTTPVTLGDGYRTYDSQESIGRTQFWRQNNHWMMDLQPRDSSGNGLLGGGMMRPDRSFRFENGKLVVESDVAAGITQYGPGGADIWPEVVVTPAAAPTGKVLDSLYAYGQFGGTWAFGCRYQPTRVPVCSLYNPDGQPGDRSLFGTPAGRVWEMSSFEQVGTTSFGGFPDTGGPLDQAWRTCNGTDPDINCRDRFRMELTKTSVTIYVNGVKYFEQTGLKVPFPDALVNGNVYVYFAGWEVRQTADTIRYHWDHLAVNPGGELSAAPPPPQAQPAPAQAPAAQAGSSTERPAGASQVGPSAISHGARSDQPNRNRATAAAQPADVARPILYTVAAARHWVRSSWLLLILFVPALTAAAGAGWWLRGRKIRSTSP